MLYMHSEFVSGIMYSMNLLEILKNTTIGVKSARKCIVKYIIWLCIMIATTMTMTLLVANIMELRELFHSYMYTSIALLFTGAFIAVLLILIPKLEVIFPLNYMLAVLSVLTSSCGLAVATSNVGLKSLMSWFLTILLTVICLIVGYKMRRFNQKGFYIMNYIISGFLLLSALLFFVLYYLQFRDAANTVFGVLLGLGLLL
ncbi:unnamed protein product, partial [Trichobilharzia szidati]